MAYMRVYHCGCDQVSDIENTLPKMCPGHGEASFDQLGLLPGPASGYRDGAGYRGVPRGDHTCPKGKECPDPTVQSLVRQLAELLEGTPFQGTIAESGDTILVDVPGPTAAVDGDSTQYYLTLREIA